MYKMDGRVYTSGMQDLYALIRRHVVGTTYEGKGTWDTHTKKISMTDIPAFIFSCHDLAMGN